MELLSCYTKSLLLYAQWSNYQKRSTKTRTNRTESLERRKCDQIEFDCTHVVTNVTSADSCTPVAMCKTFPSIAKLMYTIFIDSTGNTPISLVSIFQSHVAVPVVLAYDRSTGEKKKKLHSQQIKYNT